MYCDVSDIEAYFLNKKFNCGDYLENNEIKGFIIAETAIINSIVQKKYTLPLTDASDLLIVKTICEKLVVDTVDGIFREKTEDGKFDRRRNTKN